jgi:hypothetical protein
MGNFGLLDVQKIADLALLEFPRLQDFQHFDADLGARKQLVGVFEADVGKDVA